MAVEFASGLFPKSFNGNVSSRASFWVGRGSLCGTRRQSAGFVKVCGKMCGRKGVKMGRVEAGISVDGYQFGSEAPCSRGGGGEQTQLRVAAVGSGFSAVQERSSQNGVVSAVIPNEADENKVQQGAEGRGPLRGGLVEDGKVYREKFVIRCYEVGTNRTASMETMANLMQEAGCNHAQSVGFSTDGFATTHKMRENHLIWVTTRMHFEISEYPTWGQIVEIDTWIRAEGKCGTRRDWIVRQESGEVIGRATSMWVMMNVMTRRMSRIPEDVRSEYMVFCPEPPRYSFPIHHVNSAKKISPLEYPSQYFRSGLMPRRSDLDMNHHVNNVTYIGWMLESMPNEVLETHELSLLTLDYRRECRSDDVLESLTSEECPDAGNAVEASNGFAGSTVPVKDEKQDESKLPTQFVHLLRLVGSENEINRGRTEWRRRKVLGSSGH